MQVLRSYERVLPPIPAKSKLKVMKRSLSAKNQSCQFFNIKPYAEDPISIWPTVAEIFKRKWVHRISKYSVNTVRYNHSLMPLFSCFDFFRQRTKVSPKCQQIPNWFFFQSIYTEKLKKLVLFSPYVYIESSAFKIKTKRTKIWDCGSTWTCKWAIGVRIWWGSLVTTHIPNS